VILTRSPRSAPHTGVPLAEPRLEQLTVAVLRAAFADYAEARAKTSISRAWSTWNQFFAFCVSDGRIAGNPMAGVARPRVPVALPSR
jgi:integrase/recombinase XerC